jgi:hypothetical protein
LPEPGGMPKPPLGGDIGVKLPEPGGMPGGILLLLALVAVVVTVTVALLASVAAAQPVSVIMLTSSRSTVNSRIIKCFFMICSFLGLRTYWSYFFNFNVQLLIIY